MLNHGLCNNWISLPQQALTQPLLKNLDDELPSNQNLLMITAPLPSTDAMP
jgi:hypothetical protein